MLSEYFLILLWRYSVSNWKNYEELRPDELETILSEAPVAYWPLGLLEHHGWHLPVGFDGIKARRTCERIAARTGGLILPTMWWGGGGGHDVFKWSHYQDPEAITSMLDTTARQLLDFGVRALVLMAGHYPWQSFLDKVAPALRTDYADTLILAGSEISICGDAFTLRGDHAAKEETSFGLALFPEFVDLSALQLGHHDDVWPPSGAPAQDKRHPQVNFDPAHPLFAQMGEDSREATAAHGEEGLGLVVDHLGTTIEQFLKTATP
ncbi:MAG: creatinine amidohydrolase/Fe(II)-dependent formamide hydrolase-like protein [Candidatus Latescibacterota bacterium]